MGTFSLKLSGENLSIALTQTIPNFQLGGGSLSTPSLMVRVKQAPHATNKTG